MYIGLELSVGNERRILRGKVIYLLLYNKELSGLLNHFQLAVLKIYFPKILLARLGHFKFTVLKVLLYTYHCFKDPGLIYILL